MFYKPAWSDVSLIWFPGGIQVVFKLCLIVPG